MSLRARIIVLSVFFLGVSLQRFDLAISFRCQSKLLRRLVLLTGGFEVGFAFAIWCLFSIKHVL